MPRPYLQQATGHLYCVLVLEIPNYAEQYTAVFLQLRNNKLYLA